MAQYKVLAASFINDGLVEEGTVIEYDPPEGTEIGENLELVEGKPAKAPKAAASDAE